MRFGTLSGSGGKAQGRSRFVPMQVSAGVHGDDLTGSHASSRVDLTGETLKMVNVPKGPHRFTGKREDDGMHCSKIVHRCTLLAAIFTFPPVPIRVNSCPLVVQSFSWPAPEAAR